jgi:hypothetical protein
MWLGAPGELVRWPRVKFVAGDGTGNRGGRWLPIDVLASERYLHGLASRNFEQPFDRRPADLTAGHINPWRYFNLEPAIAACYTSKVVIQELDRKEVVATFDPDNAVVRRHALHLLRLL